ncbi:acetate kinase [Viscerimonas tarda]
MKILVLNCGSSSIKYQLFDMDTKAILAKGLVEKIGLKGSVLRVSLPNGDKLALEGEILEHKAGIEYILGVLTSEKYGCIKSLSEIDAVGHRVVHGGEKFSKSELITDDVLIKVVECIDLAPLHNPPNLAGIDAVKELMGDIPQVAVFDTAFHQTMPAEAYMYGLPYSLYEKYAIRRYGFHGTSHRYVSRRACDFLGVPYESQKIISVHIGGGGSLAAIKNGESIDTSMGMTPVEGLLMGTRSGDVDAGVLAYIMEKENVGPQTLSTIVNEFSGLSGISGISSDMRDIKAAMDEGNARAKLAFDMFCYRVKKYIGSYAAALGGIDIVIFTAGVGENHSITREVVCKNLEFLGIELDKKMNAATHGEEALISAPDSKVKVVIIPTDEEFMIASDTAEIVMKA